MQIVGIKDVGKNFTYRWPDGTTEIFDYFIEYIVKLGCIAKDRKDKHHTHTVKIGFGKRNTYGKNRIRIVVWIDNYPHAEFLGADDFEHTGEVLSEIKVPEDVGWHICRYPDDPIPDCYSLFNVVGLPLRVQGPGVHNAWAVVANIADHKTLIALAVLKKLEREGHIKC